MARARRRLTSVRDLGSVATGTLLALIVAGGAVLRWAHLGTPSLWWDEIVDLAMAQAGGVADVIHAVRHGVPVGSGNAGAMPLDYLLLHAWLAATPSPSPEHLEVHVRLPAFVWSVAALAAFAAFSRRHLGRDVALVATLLFALSIPHVLYAAEVRWYALLVLVTVGHVWAFAGLLDAPEGVGRWIVWLVVAVASVLTAVLSIIPLAAEQAVLLARTVRSRRVLAPLVASTAALAVLVAWLVAPSLGVNYGRPPTARPGLAATTAGILGFLAWDHPVLLAGLVVGPLFAWRDTRRRPLAAALALGFVAIPVVTVLADWKAYYVHPRHVIFLLPAFVILVAFGVVGACRVLVGDRWALAAATALVAVTQTPAVARYLAGPDAFFARTKTLRDTRGVVAAVAAASRGVPPGTRWLLLAERQSTPNTVLDRYLHWWGLADRVTFRGTRDVPAALQLLADSTPALERLAAPPLATIPVGLTEPLRAFLGIDADPSVPSSPLAGAMVVAWEPPASVPHVTLERRELIGVTTFTRRP